jgi:hypothetical protein
MNVDDVRLPAPRLALGLSAERPGEVDFDCNSVDRLRNMKETVWQLTAIDVRSSSTCAELVS